MDHGTKESTFWDRMAPRHEHAHGDLEKTLHDAVAVLAPDDRVLDVGCAAGASSRFLRDHVAAVHGIDISPKRIEEAKQTEREGLTFAVTTLDDPGLQGFTAITMFNVLHHLDVDAALRRCHELLPRGGKLLIEDSCFQEAGLFARIGLRILAFVTRMPPMHHHTAAQLEQAVRDAGFTIEGSKPRGGRMRTQWIVARA